MKLKLLAVLLVCFTCSYASGRQLYVSSSEGDDVNDGLTPETALLTIDRAMELGGDILLKAGDTFYGPIVCYGRSLSRYGEGPNPVVSGYKRIEGRQWKRVSLRVWKLDLRGQGFSGAGVGADASILNNIGCFHEYDKDIIHGRKVRYRDELRHDWDFWQTERCEAGVDPSEFDNVYLYSRKNPNRMNLELSIGAIALRTGNSTVDGVDFTGFGFGIAGESRTVIRNCSLDAIGGMIQIGYPDFICYGNGIEFYVARDIEDCLVEHCSVSRCYDAAMTVQGSGHPGATPKNIVFRNNLIRNCCQGWEDFLRNGDGVLFENCVFENNLVIGSGDSGFGYSDGRFKYCNVLGNNFQGDRGLIIRRNVFVGGNFYCTQPYNGRFASHLWEDNVCYIASESFLLSDYRGVSTVLRVYDSNEEEAIGRYRSLTGDDSTVFVLCTAEELDAIGTFLSTHPID